MPKPSPGWRPSPEKYNTTALMVATILQTLLIILLLLIICYKRIRHSFQKLLRRPPLSGEYSFGSEEQSGKAKPPRGLYRARYHPYDTENPRTPKGPAEVMST